MLLDEDHVERLERDETKVRSRPETVRHAAKGKMNVKRRSRKASPGDPKKAVAYLRVSTDRQDLGPEAQRKLIARWAREHGVEVVVEHLDHGISGGSDVEARPGLVAAIYDLGRHGAGVLLVAKRDRLARDVGVAALVEREVHAHGAQVVTGDGSGNGHDAHSQLVRGMADLFAAHEREMIRERTRAALAVKKSRGERTGSIPLGFRLASDGKTLVKDRREQRAVCTATKLRADGLSYRSIAERLGELNIATRTGRAWDPTQVRRMVLRAGG